MNDVVWLSTQFPDLTNLARLGAGGQKVVYSANHATHGAVVLKLIQPNQDVERVRREILAVQQVNSPRVPVIHSQGVLPTPSNGDVFWVIERRIEGAPLRTSVAAGPMPLVDLCRLGRHVLEALVGAAAARIVHRDVKPENLMRDTGGDFWLIDFGLARHLSLDSLTLTAALGGHGTLGYAPPEQYRNWKREIDSRADLFALGVTMWECATGQHPFRHGARDPADVFRRIENQPLPALTIAGDNGGMSAFITTMMQPRVDHRPSSPADALDWLRSLCSQA